MGICNTIKGLIKEKEAEQVVTGTALVVVKQEAIVARYGEVFSKKQSKTKTVAGSSFSDGYQDGRKVDVTRRAVTNNDQPAKRLAA